jgi:DNA-binding MarR family transcriptional regulator
MDQLNLAQCQFCVGANLRMASRAITKLYDEMLRPGGLQLTQFSLLTNLALAGPTTMTRLAESLIMDRTTLTRNLKPLERQGLVEIIAGADQRTREIKITPQGLEALAKSLPLWEKAQTQVVNTLGMDQFDVLLMDLSTLVSLTR